MSIRVNERVSLSEVLPADKPALVEHLNDKEIYERTLRIPYPYTAADADAWLSRLTEKKREQGQPMDWAIRNEAGLLIGCLGFDGVELGKSHRAEIGYWLAKPYWGQGLMTAIVNRMCRFAFEEWGLLKLQAHVFPPNTASARVLQKCGFVQEGYLRKHFLKDGQYLDGLLFARLR
jgi:[ribosomal protein S5]-alanine N-acetyltransferase